MLSNIIPQQNYFVIFNAYCNKNNPPQRQKEFMNSKLALMPLLIMSAFSYAADEAMPEAPVQQQLQEVHVRADAKRVKAARSYSIASDGDLRDRVNLGVLGKANAFTAPITVVNYDEQALNKHRSAYFGGCRSEKRRFRLAVRRRKQHIDRPVFPRLSA